MFNWIPRMFVWLGKSLNSAVTEADNRTHDLIKHGGWIGVAAVVYHDWYQIHHDVPVNVKDFAIALSAILVSVGIGVGVKSKTEHKESDEKEGAE